VSFSQAQTVFTDKHGLIINDVEHSTAEERFVLPGMSAASRMLVVVHCYRAEDQVIRIISARKADRIERRQKQEGS
jgi:uncharacterized DUF497 family protein